jgi:outer membrane protein assembly factor BamA
VNRRRRSALRGVALAAIVGAALAVLPAPARAQDPSCEVSDVQLLGVSFRGNSRFDDSDLRARVAVEPSSLIRRVFRIFGTERCLDSGELPSDLVRVMLFYRRHGFPLVRVDTIVERPDSNSARVTFQVEEGPPRLTDSVVVTGITDDTRRRALRALIELGPGDRLDEFVLDSGRAEIERTLRQQGRLQARVTSRVEAADGALHGTAWVDVTAGPVVHLASLQVTATPHEDDPLRVPAREVERLTRLQEGQVLGSTDLLMARANLLDAGVFASVDVAVDSITPGDSGQATTAVQVTVVESNRYDVEGRAGYGTLDCGRLQGDLGRAASIRSAGRLEFTVRLSKIGVGEPADFARALCSSAARRDIYGQRLNYYAGATYSHPAIGARGTSRALTLYSERRSEYQAYLRTTSFGALASLGHRLPRGWLASLSYDFSYGATEAEASVQCWIFGACTASDRATLIAKRPLAVLSAAVSRARTDNPADPHRGYSVRLEGRSALSVIGSSHADQFAGLVLDGTSYIPFGSRTVLATRLRLGTITNVGSGTRIPQQERFFAGGATTIRGFRHNEVGPRAYVPDTAFLVQEGGETYLRASPDSSAFRVIPSGGNTLALAGAELRWRAPMLDDIVQFVAFLDGGATWNRESELGGLRIDRLRWTPGVGVRVNTPIGPVRLDVGYANYAPDRGPAFIDSPFEPDFAKRPLFCVSPGNRLPVTFSQDSTVVTQADGPCRDTFTPAKPGGFWRRLTLHFSLGQAF